MRPPAFWAAGLDPSSREAAPLTRALLTPAAMLYAAVTAWRIQRATPARIGVPVVCIGNLTAGGTGKTPLARRVRAILSDQGVRAATLSRGYGGKRTGPLRVDPGQATAAEVGDEPLMLAADGEAWIGADRAAAARSMAADGVEAIVMDDGHQNPSLHKDLSLVVVDAEAPFGNGHVIPKGPLREPAAAGLARADAVVLMGDGPTPATFRNPPIPIFRARLAPRAGAPLGPLVVFAGVGRPRKVFDAVRAAGGVVVEEAAFADHHRYTASDLAYLRRLAEERGARLVTTEKDAARLPPADQAGVEVFHVDAVFDDAPGFALFLETALNSKSR